MLGRYIKLDRREVPTLEAISGRLALDADAVSAEADVPAYVAPPPGSPPYHGFLVMSDVTFEGFTLGAITDFQADPTLGEGDGFLVAPDGSRAGLEWRIVGAAWVVQQAEANPRRWGVFLAALPEPMLDLDAARRNLAALVPLVRPYWEAWAGRPVDLNGQ